MRRGELTPSLLKRGAAWSGRQGAVLAVLAMLAAEEAAARGSARLRASLDSRSPRRREMVQAGTEKRRFDRTEKRGFREAEAWECAALNSRSCRGKDSA